MLKINDLYNGYTNLLKYKKGYSIIECKELIKKYNLDGLEVFIHFNDEKLESLDFLSDFKFLKKLRLCIMFDYDYNFIKMLTYLEELSLDIPFAKEIDLTYQENLKHLDVTVNKLKVIGIEQLFNLESLSLFSYKEKSLKKIKDLNSLKKIKLKTASIKNLEGLENLQKLDEILLANCRSLKDLSQITNLHNIKKVFFDGCTKINDFDVLGEIPSIEEITFVDCKIIKSIKFFNKLPNLKKFVLRGTSIIEDNDLIPAKRLPLIRYEHKKKYNIELVNTYFSSIY